MTKFQLFNTYFELMYLKKCLEDANEIIKNFNTYYYTTYSELYHGTIYSSSMKFSLETLDKNIKQVCNYRLSKINKNDINEIKKLQLNIKYADDIGKKIEEIYNIVRKRNICINDYLNDLEKLLKNLKIALKNSSLDFTYSKIEEDMLLSFITLTRGISDSFYISDLFDKTLINVNTTVTKIYNKINQSSDLADELFRILQNNSFENYCNNLQLGNIQAKMITNISSTYSLNTKFEYNYNIKSLKLRQDAFTIYVYIYDLIKPIE